MAPWFHSLELSFLSSISLLLISLFLALWRFPSVVKQTPLHPHLFHVHSLYLDVFFQRSDFSVAHLSREAYFPKVQISQG